MDWLTVVRVGDRKKGKAEELKATCLLYARHLAWLRATPKQLDGKRGVAPIKAYLPTDPAFKMPEADRIMVDAFHRIGESKSNGMGLSPIGWVDVDAFCNRSGYELGKFECNLLVDMSRAYCSAYYQYNDEHQQEPPYARQFTKDEWRERSKSIMAAVDRTEREMMSLKKPR